MKIAILGDVHFSLRNGHPILNQAIKKFFDDVFFPIIKREEVKVVFQTGDVYDGRKSNNTDSIKMSKECFFDKLQQEGIEYHQIIGNHDAYFKETLIVNSPRVYLTEYDNVHIYDTPETIKLGNTTFDMIPWICDDNRTEITNHMTLSTADIAFGHFEINGFEMSKNNVCEHGISMESFKRYKHVWSGHFHKKMKVGNIQYVGSPTQHTWDDVDEPRGFHIYDTATDTLTFYENPNNLFVKIVYDDNTEVKDSPEVEGRYVKIIGDNVTDRKRFEKYVDEIYLFSPIEIKSLDKVDEIAGIEVDLDDLESGTFNMVNFLYEYSTTSHIDMTDDEKSILKEQYKIIYENAISNEDD